MKITTYEPQYDKAGRKTIGMKGYKDWITINPRYVKSMQSYLTTIRIFKVSIIGWSLIWLVAHA